MKQMNKPIISFKTNSKQKKHKVLFKAGQKKNNKPKTSFQIGKVYMKKILKTVNKTCKKLMKITKL